MKRLFAFLGLTTAVFVSAAQAQTIWTYDFGTSTGSLTTGASTNTFLPAPQSGGGTNVVRVGTGGGQFDLINPGGGSYLQGTASTSSSVNKFSIYNYDSPSTAFTLSFDVQFLGGSSGVWSLFTGDGTSFTSSTASFTGNDTFTGLRFAYGASGALAISNRAGGNWVALNGTGISQSNSYSISIYGNNGASSIDYGGNTLASGRYDLWVGGLKTVTNIAKAQLAGSANIDSFMFYGESSTGNVATIQLDNISYANYAVPEPSTYAMLALSAAGLGAYMVRRRRR
jgi:hypothetical protein